MAKEESIYSPNLQSRYNLPPTNIRGFSVAHNNFNSIGKHIKSCDNVTQSDYNYTLSVEELYLFLHLNYVQIDYKDRYIQIQA